MGVVTADTTTAERTPVVAAPRSRRMRVLSTIRRGWLKFAEKLGTIQMIVIMSIVYWVGIIVMEDLTCPLVPGSRSKSPSKELAAA